LDAYLVESRESPCGRVFYTILVKLDGRHFRMNYRFSELLAKHNNLRRIHPEVASELPPFPLKTQWRVKLGMVPASPDARVVRQAMLEDYVYALARTAPTWFLRELLWCSANWHELSPKEMAFYSIRDTKLERDGISERTTQAGSFDLTLSSIPED
jgi:hypothetical protein